MRWIVNYLDSGTKLNYSAKVHYSDSISYVAGYREIVSDKDVGDARAQLELKEIISHNRRR
jgi:hypothetical protein